ncbi:LysM peptidoglycan-binding domain-containing protein [Burkholderia sp. B21-005]|uniref:LysM peptidoglycan-binding domain-containing protein n=1 Tax=Burkholderia sp. B21-005 TaxID=2890406 RepID=UPI001E5EBBE9|nr:tail protein X [Burkholderia sp. B21-005]UEP42717.1 tail protein X [Burkholderia sp. B21-005]UEP43179.1 tail protein X [Burkholderia sp. B21-005]
MTTTDNSRADALTRCPLLVDADCLYGPYGMNGETVCKFCGFAKDAARPVEQPRTHTTQPGESVMGIALRQCGNEMEWRHILACNPEFADMLPHEYFPVGTVLTLPPPPAGASPVEQHEAAPSDDAMAISDAMRMDDEGRINEQCPSRCQHPSWKSIGSDQDQCEICGAVGSERRYLAVQPESSSVADEASDCGCATNEACKMKTDGSCWRAD